MNLVGKTMRASKNFGRFVATARINTGTTCQDHEDDDGVDDGKGTFQKRFSGIRPLRGGGYPPFPLRKKTFFFSH